VTIHEEGIGDQPVRDRNNPAAEEEETKSAKRAIWSSNLKRTHTTRMRKKGEKKEKIGGNSASLMENGKRRVRVFQKG